MRALLSSVLVFAFLAYSVSAEEGRIVTLAIPHALAAGETIVLEVKLGVVQRGAEIEIATTAGKFLGVVSPYGIRAGGEAGTYTVPLPVDAISDNRVSLRLTLTGSGQAKRAPTIKEVTNVRLKIVPAARAKND